MCWSVCVPCACNAHGVQSWALDLLELELTGNCEPPDEGAGIWFWVDLWEQQVPFTSETSFQPNHKYLKVNINRFCSENGLVSDCSVIVYIS